MKNQIREFFPGGNTSKGFYSFYRYILGQEDARRIICIKGGPGTGKSTLMKKLANHFYDAGYDIELHHCSSDNNSLDGVVVKPLNLAILDGTSPHVVDPVNPGAVDEVLNMGDCWNEEGFKQSRRSIIETNKEIGKTFKRAYRYLSAARTIHDDWSNFNEEALSAMALNKLKQELGSKIFSSSMGDRMGFDRHLFATAFTPNGIVTYIDTLCTKCENVYVLNGGPGTGRSEVLSYLANEAMMRGFYVEVLHEPLVPERIEHIIIPEIKTAVLTSNEINDKTFDGTEYFMEDLQNHNLLNKNKSEISYDKKVFHSLLGKALATISSAKALHDQLETYFVPNMDFKKIDEKYDFVLNKFLTYSKEL